jgi:hypothetical protein
MCTLWNKKQEENFFRKSLELAAPEKLFYITKDGKSYAYWPKNYKGPKATLQSRNALIGSYTEKWCSKLFKEIAEAVDAYPVTGVICEEIGLTRKSPADVAICRTEDIIQKPQNILLIFEVKMSIIWNWELVFKDEHSFDLICIGDYKTHQGNPSLLRSDTMLKAIGKSINIRISSLLSSKIPIIVIGNSPINISYYKKADQLRSSGIIQGFWSVNPNPLDDNNANIKSTFYNGFYTFDSYEELKQKTFDLLNEDREFFSGMQSKKRLGEIIEIADKELTYEQKALCFLKLIKETEK